MLVVCTGKPRSGKSYYVVKNLLKYCDFDPISGLYVTKPRVLIISNIDGLKFNHRKLHNDMQSVCIEEHEGARNMSKASYETPGQFKFRQMLTAYFCADRWQKIAENYDKIIFAIDEAQRIFPSSDRLIPNSVWYFFEYHGHFGADMFLMCQGAEAIHRRILVINETFIEAESATMRTRSKDLKYYKRDSIQNTIVGTDSLTLDPMIYKAYKSARHDEGIKERKSFIGKYYYYALAIALLCPVGLYFFISTFKSIGEKGKPVEVAKVEAPSPESPKKDSPLQKVVNVVTGDEPLTRVDALEWSINGIPTDQIERLPISCKFMNNSIVCPVITLPKELASITASQYCKNDEDGNKYACMAVFPLKALKEREHKRNDYKKPDREIKQPKPVPQPVPVQSIQTDNAPNNDLPSIDEQTPINQDI